MYLEQKPVNNLLDSQLGIIFFLVPSLYFLLQFNKPKNPRNWKLRN